MTVALDISLFGYVDYYLFIMIILSLKAVFFSLAMLNQKKQKKTKKWDERLRSIDIPRHFGANKSRSVHRK